LDEGLHIGKPMPGNVTKLSRLGAISLELLTKRFASHRSVYATLHIDSGQKPQGQHEKKANASECKALLTIG